MSQRASEGLGERLARYRRLAGLSARELAERTGMGLTRGVIANIESGRKSDITVDQLLALSVALGVRPVVLALPVEKPYKAVRLTEGANAAQSARSFAALDLFQDPALDSRRRMFKREDADNEGTLISEELVRSIREWTRSELELSSARKLWRQGSLDDGAIREREEELEFLRSKLARLGADLTEYAVDD